MKNFLKLIGIVVLVLAIGFSFVACDDDAGGGGGGGGGAGRLVINGLPPGQYDIYVLSNRELPTNQIQAAWYIAEGYIAMNLSASGSPFALTTFQNNTIPFSQSGRFYVVLQGGDGSFVNRVLNNVQFTDGSATINFGNMTDVASLPYI